MMNFLPVLYPGETIQSFIFRYHTLNGNTNFRLTGIELFNRTKLISSSTFPSDLEKLSAIFNSQHEYSSDYIVDEHTILPLYRPFLLQERYEQIKKDMKSGDAKILNFKIGEAAGGICKGDGLKVCTSCLESEEHRYGEMFPRTIDQIPGNYMCQEHEELLQMIDENSYLEERKIDKGRIAQIPKLDKVHIISVLNEIKQLSYDINYIYNVSKIQEVNLKKTISKYITRLYEKGWLLSLNTVDWPLVIESFKEFYSEEFLSIVESELAETYCWIRRVTKTTTLVHPIRHLIFIRFLFGSVETFINYKEGINLFGEGPWPCLNPIADHFKYKMIEKCEISRRSTLRKPVGIFTCPGCGFSYYRKGPDTKSEDMYMFTQIKTFGFVWMEELKKNILRGHYTITQLSDIMQSDSKTVAKYADELGLLDRIDTNCKFERASLKSRRYNQALEEEYMERVQEFIASNANAIRKDIGAHLPKEYAWVFRYKRDWLNSILPPISPKGDRRKQIERRDWKLKDRELQEEIQKFLKKINKDDYYERLTVNLFMKELQINDRFILNKVPDTKKMIYERIESVEDYHIRLIESAIKEFKEKGINLNEKDILDKVKLRRKNNYKYIRDFFDSNFFE